MIARLRGNAFLGVVVVVVVVTFIVCSSSSSWGASKIF